MLLERAIDGATIEEGYPLPERDGVADWAPLVEAARHDVSSGAGQASIAARFHNALADWIVAVAARIGVKQVTLSGGVFQNGYLVERAAALLESRGFTAFTHQRVPANDGGIALGQAVLSLQK